MKRKDLMTPLVGVLAVAALAGCGGGDDETGTTGAAGAASTAAKEVSEATGGLPKLEKKDTYKVGFAQTESNNPWRLAQTKSMQDEAKEKGWELVYTDAGGSAAKQVADVQSMVAQRVDAIFLAPREEKPLIPAVMAAKAAGIPVILLDRNVDQSLAKAGKDYVTFIGSDFIEEGNRAAEWLAKETGGKGTVVELEGTTGSSPANDRKKGFHDYIKENAPDLKVVASQSGDFARDKGRQVMETMLQSHPDLTAVYAHNDEMAIGAIQALEAAGKKPGQDVTIVSIDGTRDALQAIVDGKLGATVECNPRFGPKAYETLEKYAAGEQIPEKIINEDKFFSKDNAQEELPNAY